MTTIKKGIKNSSAEKKYIKPLPWCSFSFHLHLLSLSSFKLHHHLLPPSSKVDPLVLCKLRTSEMVFYSGATFFNTFLTLVFFTHRLTETMSMTNIAPPSAYNRPTKSLKLPSERRPFFVLSMPAPCLKTRPFNLHSVRSSNEASVTFPGILSNTPSPGENEQPVRPRNVQFASEEEMSEGKAGPLPRTPYPMTSQDEERIQRMFSRPSGGDLELVPE